MAWIFRDIKGQYDARNCVKRNLGEAEQPGAYFVSRILHMVARSCPGRALRGHPWGHRVAGEQNGPRLEWSGGNHTSIWVYKSSVLLPPIYVIRVFLLCYNLNLVPWGVRNYTPCFLLFLNFLQFEYGCLFSFMFICQWCKNDLTLNVLQFVRYSVVFWDNIVKPQNSFLNTRLWTLANFHIPE